MALLYAAYMAGALMVGLPILLHLLRRKPKEQITFPSFMFLTQTATQRQQKNAIRKWLVLLARCLILLLLSLAFAWPFIPRFDKQPDVATVLLWDNSFSMNASPYREQLIERAGELIGETDLKHPMQIGLIGDRVEWSGEMDGDGSRLMSFFQQRPPAEGGSRFERAIRQADLKLQRSAGRQQRIVVITDNQLVPWQDVRLTAALRPGAKLEVITPEQAGFRNVAVHDARIDTRFTEADQALALRVQARNYQSTPAEATLETWIGDDVVDRRAITLSPMSTQQITVTLPPLPLESAIGRVHLTTDDELPIDNDAWFAINPASPPTVGVFASKRNRQATLYVELAMNPSPDVMRVEIVHLSDEPTLEDLQACNMILLAEAPALGSTAADRLESVLLSGGTVVAVWQDASAMRHWLRQWDIQAAPPSQRRDRRLAAVDFEHPIFAPFLDVRVGGIFEVLYFNPPTMTLPDKARVLARFDSGSPAILEQNAGEGKLFVVASELTRQATNWPTHSSFLPFWRELLAYASHERKDEHHHAVSNRPLPMEGITTVVDAAGQPMKLERDRFTPRSAGGYFVETQADKRFALAVNAPSAESDPLLVGDAFSVAGLVSTDEPKAAESDVIAMPEDHGRSFWWLVLASTGILMLLEMVLANRTVL